MCMELIKDISSIASGFGTFITGLAAIFAVPQLKKYRQERQYDRIEKGLINCTSFIDAVSYVASSNIVFSTSKDTRDSQSIVLEERNLRYRAVHEKFEAFWDIIDCAELYLDDNTIEIVNRLRTIWRNIDSAFMTYVASGGFREGRGLEAFHNEAFGDKYKEELKKIKQEIKGEMKKYRDFVK